MSADLDNNAATPDETGAADVQWLNRLQLSPVTQTRDVGSTANITPCLENGKTGFVDFLADGEVGRGSTEFIVLRSKRLTPEFVYCLARTHAFRGNAIKSTRSNDAPAQTGRVESQPFSLSPPQYLPLVSAASMNSII